MTIPGLRQREGMIPEVAVGEEIVLCSAEGLGIILFCMFCEVAIIENHGDEWDVRELRELSQESVREDGKVCCWNCLREWVALPTAEIIDEYVKLLEDRRCALHSH